MLWQRKHIWARYDGLLHEIMERRMKGKPTRGMRRFPMLHGLKKVMAMPHSSEQLKKEGMEIQ